MSSEAAKRDGPEKLIGRIAGTIGALVLIAGTINAVISYAVPHTTSGFFRIISVSLNLVVLIIYCLVSITAPRLDLKEDGNVGIDYCELLKVPVTGERDALITSRRKTERVNRLVVQLHNNIVGYAVSLIVVYLLYLLDNQWFFETYLPESIHYQYISAAIKVIIGIFNYLSAVFLYLGFIVLYDKTIKPDDVTPHPYHRNAWIFSIGFLLVYIIFSVTFVTGSVVGTNPGKSINSIKDHVKSYDGANLTKADEKLKEVRAIANNNLPAPESMDKIDQVSASYANGIKASASETLNKIDEEIASDKNKPRQIIFNVFYLFIGICNGLAMFLLFGRYVSMGHSVFSMEDGEYKEKKYSKSLHFFTIYILPLYALAQPLFGSFEIDAFGPRETFANGVFLVCWIGKIGFLYLTYVFMKTKLMHLYLHTGVNDRGLPQKLVGCFRFDS